MHMELSQKIRQLGLSEKETAVYLGMLEVGAGSITEITHSSGQKRPTVYLALDRLEMLGLAERALQGKKKLWSAVHPRRLKELADFRAVQIEGILPELVALYRETRERPVVRILEGVAGARTAYQEAYSLLNSRQEGLWFGNITFLIENFPELLREYNALLRQIRDPHIRELIYGGEKSEKWVNDMQRTLSKNHRIRYYGDGIEFGTTDQLVIGDKVMSFSFGKEVFVLITESKELAATQRGIFEHMWQSRSGGSE